MTNYLYFEDTGVGSEFWGLVNNHLLNNRYSLQHKNGIRGVRKALQSIDNACKYFVIIDYIVDNIEIFRECVKINGLAQQNNNITVIKIHSFEQLLLSFTLLCTWVNCPAGLRTLVNQFNSVYGQGIKQALNQTKHKELIKFITERVSGSSEQLSKVLLSDVMYGTGFAFVRDRILKKRILGPCWKCNCCGVERKEFQVPTHFKEYCILSLSLSEKLIAIRDNSALSYVCNILGLA